MHQLEFSKMIRTCNQKFLDVDDWSNIFGRQIVYTPKKRPGSWLYDDPVFGVGKSIAV